MVIKEKHNDHQVCDTMVSCTFLQPAASRLAGRYIQRRATPESRRVFNVNIPG